MADPTMLPDLSHGEHCCLIFSSPEEQTGVTVAFLALGLQRGERSMFVGDDASVARVWDGLCRTGVDVDREVRDSRLVLSSGRDYLDHGRFCPDKMLSFLDAAYDAALAEGATALRATGDVSWEVGPLRDFQDVLDYEAMLDLFFTGRRMIGMCQYPRHACPPDVLSGILHTHRVAAIDRDLCTNPHYVPPQILLEKNTSVRQRRRAEWMTSQLQRTRRAEEERDQLQAQLSQAQKMEAMGRLACGVVHDFNNLLTVIAGYSDIALADPEIPQRSRTAVEEVKKAGERASWLTRQLLAFSRKQAHDARVIDLNRVLAETDKMIRRLIGTDIEVVTAHAPNLWSVKVDPGQIEQVLMNLVVNARDAMPQGGTLALETANVELDHGCTTTRLGLRPGPHVRLTVSDSGCGMDAATQARIFEPFFTTKGKDQGTGLGLATVYGIVKQSGGSISVNSRPGEGTAFEVYLPRSVEEHQPAVAEALRPIAARGDETILLVEDEPSLLPLFAEVLRRSGHRVLEAVNGIEALEVAGKHVGTIDLLITDLMMPGMGGAELIQALTRSRPELKALCISGFAERDACRRGAAPDVAYLQKPFTPGALSEKVREVLVGHPRSVGAEGGILAG